ncbi:putative receptor-type tyrosine-protein phosphatase kappa [Apostichopus japonicus]|uniref:Putative receptor-type tyrosine-protein phosphatase kappa n=1 Tax=Stichopus japonicus TaxID=307972 RepID=A0A2G8JY91_STIJA|nr:putative receptor-type tyrosine-protein phosphatase kappa [Apostichopus japonicus]
MNHEEYNDKSTVIIGAGRDQKSMCVLPGSGRRKRASELVSGQTLTARNDPLESAKNYSIFLRIYVLSTNGEYCYESSSYQSFKTKSDNSTEMSQSPMTGLVVALIFVVFIIILVVSIAVVVIFRRKSTQMDSDKTQSNKVDMNYENEGLSRSTVYVNEQQTSNVDALSYEPVQNQASGGIQLDKLPRALPDSKVESSDDYEVTAIPKQNTALPEPPVSQDLDKVIYEDMPDELNYSHALYNQEKAPVPFKVSELPEYIHQRRLGGRNALEMEFMTLPQGQLEPWTEAVKSKMFIKDVTQMFYLDQHNRQSFIAAESPSEDTAGAFLWMIWQEKVAIVVMVSDMNESAEQTCSPYWPMKEGTSRHYGKMSVVLKGIKNYPDYSVRELLIMKKGEDSISVTQFHYHSWPYRRVAEHPTSLLVYIKDVKLCLKRKHFPLLVHCSDGAGATGTFIGLFCLLNELTQSSEISIYHFVKKMRKNRINMVGTKVRGILLDSTYRFEA